MGGTSVKWGCADANGKMVGPDGSLVTAGAIRGLEGFPLKSEIEGSPDWLHSLRELVEGESRFGMHSCMMGR